ncbi:OmpH family outer membrane protein [Anatilimnocola sp. NA78]|uniref:OmpH family outer membrane protein n=1 Tax=Anatilimnocola sp. NA78 TaxID=3415683 RepID=UPI003CE4BCC4
MPIQTSRLLVCLVASLFALPMVALAQEKTSDFPVAVLNLDKVFNAFKKHAERLEPLRGSAKELDETVQVRQVEMETAANQLRKAPPGSPEQQRAQMQIVKLQTELRQFVEQERQKLQKRELAMIIASQREIDEQVKKICKERGLKLVLREYSPPNENQPLQELAKNLNRDVIYQEGLDITDDVIKALNEAESK